MHACSEQGSYVYEVSSQLQVRSLIPWLHGVLQLLQDMLELAQDFTDKVQQQACLIIPFELFSVLGESV